MANINLNEIGYNEVLAAGTANALMVQYKRANAAPLDITEVFTNLDLAKEYAANGATSYAGQILAVAGKDIKTQAYMITSGGTLEKLIGEVEFQTLAENAGKIDTIKVNGSALTIEDKAVNIDLTSLAEKTWVTDYVISAVTGGQVSLDGYATEKWVEDKGYITANDESVTSKASKDEVSLISGVVKTIIGNDINLSMRDVAAAEVALIVGEAPEKFDTLKEIADYISNDVVSAATIANDINGLKQNVETIEENISILSSDSHTHANKSILDEISEERVDNWDSALENAKSYAKGLVEDQDGVSRFDSIGSAAQALQDAKDYADGKFQVAGSYEAAGAAAQALVDAKDYTNDEIAKLSEVYDVKGAAGEALQDAKTYAEGLAANYDAKGDADKAFSAATADTKSQIEALNLDNTYEAKGDAAKAFSAATADTKSQIEALDLKNTYEAKGAAAQALVDAKGYTDDAIEELDLKNTYASKSVVEKLVGEDTNKSVRDVAAEEVAKVVADADEKYDTLKEIADYIANDITSAATLSNTVSDIKDLVETLSGDSHTHENKQVLDGINADKVAVWDGTLASAKTYADSLAVNYDEKGAADKAFSAATADTKSQIEALNLANSYDAKGAAAQALEDAKGYTDDAIEGLDLENTYEAKGAAANAFSAATADTKSQIEALDLKNSYDAKGAAAQALGDAKVYADNLVENLKPYTGGTAVDITDYTVNVKVAADSADKKNFIEVNASNELEMSAITLDAAITSKDIVIEGGAWETAVKAIYTGGTVPAGTTWESFLESMLCVEKWAPSVALSESFTVSCSAPGAGITGAEHNKSYEVGTKVTLSGVNAKTTTASQSVTVKEFKGADGKVYGYKVGADGAHVNSSAYTESLTPTKTGSNDALKETFTGFTDANGTAIATVSGKSSLDAVEMYLNDGTNQATVSQTGDTYQSSSAVTGGTLYIATNLKNYYKTNKKDDNTISLSATVTAKTATNSSTYKVTGYRNTFYGVTFSGDTCDAAFIRTLTKTNKEMAANGEISVTTADGTSGNRMVIASPRTLKSVKNATATQDITTTLTNTHQVIQVPGLNGYKPINYNVYDFTWKEAFGADTWKIIFN